MKRSTEGSSFFSKIKSINSFGDLYDLQQIIDKEIASNGLSTLDDIAEDAIAVATDATETIPLLFDLIKHLLFLLKSDEKLRNQILEKFHRFRTRREKEFVRLISLQILAEYHPKRTSQYLIDVACDQSESSFMRKEALKCLELYQAENVSLSQLFNIFEWREDEYMSLVLRVLEKQRQHANFEEAQKSLEEIARQNDMDLAVRCHAIEVLGFFGDMELFERLCLLRKTKSEFKASLDIFMDRLFSRPINILKISPENFEHLIKELLVELGYQKVSVTRKVRDEGVDIVAYKNDDLGMNDGLAKVIVQCKKYSTEAIGPETLKELENTIKKQRARAGLLVTTSTFSRDTRTLSEECKYIDLIDRDELQHRLDKAFGEGCYCIGNHQ